MPYILWNMGNVFLCQSLGGKNGIYNRLNTWRVDPTNHLGLFVGLMSWLVLFNNSFNMIMQSFYKFNQFFGLKIRFKSCLIRFENCILKYVIRFETCIPFNSRIVSAFNKIQLKHILLICWRFTTYYIPKYNRTDPTACYLERITLVNILSYLIQYYWAFHEFGTLLCYKSH